MTIKRKSRCFFLLPFFSFSSVLLNDTHTKRTRCGKKFEIDSDRILFQYFRRISLKYVCGQQGVAAIQARTHARMPTHFVWISKRVDTFFFLSTSSSTFDAFNLSLATIGRLSQCVCASVVYGICIFHVVCAVATPFYSIDWTFVIVYFYICIGTPSSPLIKSAQILPSNVCSLMSGHSSAGKERKKAFRSNNNKRTKRKNSNMRDE